MSASGVIPADIESHQFDAIVIGGGINGAGIARDAAMRGLDVLLIDRNDVASGTTPWSTRLIHGGLRYLEHGEVGLVRESLRERETLLRIAPHLVKPIEFLLPVYNQQRRGMPAIRAGMVIYDLLSAGKSLPRHRMLSRVETRRMAPGIADDGLRGAALYYDAQVTFPERLVVENLIDAVAHGATIITRATAIGIVPRAGHVAGVDVRLDARDDVLRLHATTVINAAGPWVDLNLADLESRPLIDGTQGSHIIVDRFPGAPCGATYAEAAEDGRPFFVIPWQEWLLIGTTDVPFAGDPADARPSSDEIDYLIRQTNAAFPTATLNGASIHVAYAGVRPLPAMHGKKASEVTRRHFIRHHSRVASGLFSVIGGKLTTYRGLAEEVTDIMCRRVGHGDRCRTADAPLPGSGDTTVATQRMHAAGVPQPAIARLLSVYGSRATHVARALERTATLAGPPGQIAPLLAAEMLMAVGEEFAQSVSDVLLRRTMLGLRPGRGLDLLEPALEIARHHLGWSEARAEAERRAYLSEIQRLTVL